MEETFKNIMNWLKDFFIDFALQVKELFLGLWDFIYGIFTSLFGKTGGELLLMGLGFLILILILLKLMNRN